MRCKIIMEESKVTLIEWTVKSALMKKLLFQESVRYEKYIKVH
jgi:hypothetical protein